MQMRRPYAHFKHGRLPIQPCSPSCPLAYTQRNHSHVSQSGGLLRWQWVSVMPTRCKTFQLLAESWAVWYLLTEHLRRKSLQLNYSLPLRIDISYIYVLWASISLFILTLNLEYVNIEGGRCLERLSNSSGRRGEKKKQEKRQGNTCAVLHKRYAMCPC